MDNGIKFTKPHHLQRTNQSWKINAKPCE